MVKATESLPNRIREWRLRRALKISDLAERVGTSTAQVGRMELGVRTVSIEWLERLARALDVAPGDLLSKSDNPNLPNEREQLLLAKLREGGEAAMKTAEAVAEAQRSFTGAPPMFDGAAAA